MIGKLHFLSGVATHVIRAITFRADGAGLPQTPTAAFKALLVLAVAAATLRHGVIVGDLHPGAAAIGAMLSFTILAFVFGKQRFPCLSIYLCVSIGVDSSVMLGDGLVTAGMASVWELAGLVVGCLRFGRRQSQADLR